MARNRYQAASEVLGIRTPLLDGVKLRRPDNPLALGSPSWNGTARNLTALLKAESSAAETRADYQSDAEAMLQSTLDQTAAFLDSEYGESFIAWAVETRPSADELRARFADSSDKFAEFVRDAGAQFHESRPQTKLRFPGVSSDVLRERSRPSWNTQPGADADDVREIREKHAAGAKQADLAREYGMSATLVHNIVRRRGRYAGI